MQNAAKQAQPSQHFGVKRHVILTAAVSFKEVCTTHKQHLHQPLLQLPDVG
jgi:hypothetical protein